MIASNMSRAACNPSMAALIRTQLVEEMSPFTAGLWLLPAAGALVLVSMLAPAIARRVGPAYVLGAALALSAAGYLILTQVDSGGGSGLPVLVTGFVVVYAGISPVMVLGADLIVGAAPPEKAGSAAALSETSTELGVSLGVAVLGSTGTAIYRDQTADTLPGEVPATAAEAGRDSLAGAAMAADGLPDRLQDALLTPARAAFTDGLNVISGISGLLLATLAVLALTMLRGNRSSGTDTEDSGDVATAGEPADAAPETAPLRQ